MTVATKNYEDSMGMNIGFKYKNIFQKKIVIINNS